MVNDRSGVDFRGETKTYTSFKLKPCFLLDLKTVIIIKKFEDLLISNAKSAKTIINQT